MPLPHGHKSATSLNRHSHHEHHEHHDEFDLDAIIRELGNFGRYQIRVFIYLMLCVMSKAIFNMQYVFTAGPVEYRCRVPECETVPVKFDTEPWGKFALPPNRNCWRRVPIGSTCEPSSFSTATQRCTSWVYADSNSIVYDFDLACQEWKRTMVGTIRSFAYFTGLPFTAFFSDTYGRRKTLIVTALFPAFIGVARSFSTSYYMFLFLEYLEAFIGCGTYSTAFILGLELVDLKKRVVGGNILSITYAVGQAILGVTAMNLPYWRHLTVALFSPAVLFIFYICIAEESIRWLVSKGRHKEAAEIITNAARVNNTTLSHRALKMLAPPKERKKTLPSHEDIRRLVLKRPQPKPKSLFVRLMKSRTILFRLFVCSFTWMTMALVYYGVSINSVSLAGNRYMNFIFTVLIEIPGYMLSIVTLDRFGRKSSIMTAFFLCGVALLSIGFVTNPTLIIVMTMWGKMCISMVFASIYIYTIELFPTEARHMLMGICSMVGRLGSMSAPQTPLLMVYMEALPYLVFGTMSAISGMLMMLTPETLKMKLPDTIEQAEDLNSRPRATNKADGLK